MFQNKNFRFLNKLMNFTPLKIINMYYKRVYKGYRVYRKYLKKIGGNKTLIVHGWPGMGDIFLIQMFLNQYLEKEKINDHFILVQGNAALQTVSLFQKNVCCITQEEKELLICLSMFLGENKLNIKIVHHDPPQNHIRLGGSIQGINFTTTRDMLLVDALGIMESKSQKLIAPKFDYDETYVNDLFEENKLIMGNTVIIAPFANSCENVFTIEQWNQLARLLTEAGFTVCTNCADEKDIPLIGTCELRFPLKYSKAILEKAGYFISMRSGLCDIVGFAKCKKIILYKIGNKIGINGNESDYFNLNKIQLSNDAIEYKTNKNLADYTIEQILSDLTGSEKKLCSTYATILADKNTRITPYFDGVFEAIAFSCSDEYVPYLAVTLESLIDNVENNKRLDIVIIEDDISLKNKSILLETYSSTYISIRFVNVISFLASKKLYTWGKYRPIMYGRFLIPELMQEYNKVLYLDSDLIINTDISNLLCIQMEENELLAAVRDVGMINTYYTPGCIEKEYFEETLNISCPDDYINSGVLLLNVKPFSNMFSSDYLLSFVSSRQWLWQDQDVIMSLFEGKIKYIDQKWNVMLQTMPGTDQIMGCYAPFEIRSAYEIALNDPYIIHFISNKHLWLEEPAEYSSLFWSYAKETPYYEVILYRAIKYNVYNRLIN